MGGLFLYRIDHYRHVLQGRHDDVVVSLTAVAPDGTELPAGTETLSDEALTLIARADAAKRDDETWPAYEARMCARTSWSQRDLISVVSRRRSAPVILRRVLERVLAPVKPV